MALPTVTDIKAVLKIQHTAQDAVLAGMHARACALIIGVLGRPYEATTRTWIDECGHVRAYSAIRSLMVPVTPIDPSSLVIEDADGEILAVDTDYRAPLAWDGVVRAAAGACFSNPPYTLTANVGLSASYGSDGQIDYETVIEPVIAQALIDTVSDWFQRRNPAAASEGTGGGVSTSWKTAGLPDRLKEALGLDMIPRIG